VDAHTVRITSAGGSRDVTAASIVIAVGTLPAAPPGVPVDGTTVLTSDDIGKLTRIPRSLTVVGAGVVGIEYASMFAALGATEVTLVDRRERPLEFLDAEIVDELMHQMRKRNVTFRCGEAAGDVIGYPSLAATSSEQGRLAACCALGAPARAMAAHFPIGIYAIPEIGMVGATEQDLTAQRVPYEVGVARYREIARGQIIGDESGLFKMLFHRDDRRLLGVHIIGTGATELLHIGQAVMGLGAGLDYFLDTVFNYPTLAECYKVAALNAANKLMA
jgi:NAD(P) transhydrogenase